MAMAKVMMIGIMIGGDTPVALKRSRSNMVTASSGGASKH
jgi:hypothetical protein